MLAAAQSSIRQLCRSRLPALLPVAEARRGPIWLAMRHERQRAAMQSGLAWSVALTLFCATIWWQRGAERAPDRTVERTVEALRRAPAVAQP